MLKPLLLLLALSLTQSNVLAAELQPFLLTYKASYGNMEATAMRSLSQPVGSGNWEMKSKVEVKLLGATLTGIEETSSFGWQHELPVSVSYNYEQKGLGKRQRKLEFAAAGQSANYTNGDKSGVITLTPPAFDSLNSTLVLRNHLLAGETDISFAVADKTEASIQHYHVAGKENIVTPAGTFNSVHIQRVRDNDSKRTTDLWLAPEHDYVLVKLLQTEPDGNIISLQLKTGAVGGQAI